MTIPNTDKLCFESRPADERAAAIRARVLAQKAGRSWEAQNAHLARAGYLALKESEGLPRRIRRGLRSRARLESIRFAVDDYDLLAGNPVFTADALPHRRGGTIPDADYDAMTDYLKRFGPEPGQTGHCELDRTLVFKVGLGGLKAKLARQAERFRGERRETVQAFALALEGLIAMIGHAAEAVEAAIPAARPARRLELEQMARSCRRIQHEPPETLMDALQLIWFIDWGVQVGDHVALVGPGHLDRTLRPFYRNDLRRGRIDEAGILQLLEALYFHINANIPDGLAIPVMVGGRDARGRDVTHRLSYLCLEALRRTRLVYPTVGVAWHEGTPEALTALAVDLIAKGYSTPAFFGDETIQRGLKRYGVE